MIISVQPLSPGDHGDAIAIINAAARWYREFLPEDELHDPEMSEAEWGRESERMTWFGAFDNGALVGVASLEYVADVALLRHAYVLRAYQRQGTGSLLTRALEDAAQGVDRIIVGTYRDNYKARGALEKLGYVECEDSDAVLRAYYAILDDRRETSVAYEKRRVDGS